MSDDNGNSEEPKKGLLAELHKQWVLEGSKEPTEKQAKKLIADWKAIRKVREVAEKEFREVQQKESAAVRAIILARGKGRFKIGSAVYTPMARGETCYLRAEGGKDVPSFG